MADVVLPVTVTPEALDPIVPEPAARFSRLGPVPGSRLVVVGGCGGIGRALVNAAVEIELGVAVLDRAAALATHAPPAGATPVPVDVTDLLSVAVAVKTAEERLGGIDGLVYLSGFADPPAALDDQDEARVAEMLDVNLQGAFRVIRAALPHLRVSGRGALVTVSSGLALSVEKGFAAYAASKAGLIALTKVVARENAPAVRANAVAPGPVETAFLSGGLGRGGAEGREGWFHRLTSRADIERSIPMARVAVPEDVVGPILFLLGDASVYMTGQVLYVNGGRLTP